MPFLKKKRQAADDAEEQVEELQKELSEEDEKDSDDEGKPVATVPAWKLAVAKQLPALAKILKINPEAEVSSADATDTSIKAKPAANKNRQTIIRGAIALAVLVAAADFLFPTSDTPEETVEAPAPKKPKKKRPRPGDTPPATETPTPAEGTVAATPPTDIAATSPTPADGTIPTTPTDPTVAAPTDSTVPAPTDPTVAVPADPTTPVVPDATLPTEAPPTTDTPVVTETPVAPDSTVTETPIPETPVAETPTSETPVVTESPPVEAPVTETPPDAPTTSPDAPVSTDTPVPDGGEPPTPGGEGTATDQVVDGTVPTSGEGDMTEKILEDLEKQLKENQPATAAPVVKDYVRPPSYEYTGRGLVYNCRGKHWACVDAGSYSLCQQNHSYLKDQKKAKECYPDSVYQTDRACGWMQRQKITGNTKTDFCE